MNVAMPESRPARSLFEMNYVIQLIERQVWEAMGDHWRHTNHKQWSGMAGVASSPLIS